MPVLCVVDGHASAGASIHNNMTLSRYDGFIVEMDSVDRCSFLLTKDNG